MSVMVATRTAAVALPMPGMVTTWTCGETGRPSKASHVSDQIADQRFGHVAVQGSDRLPGGQLELLGQFRREVRDLLERGEPGLSDALSGGVLVEQAQHPGRGDVVGQRGQFGKDAGQEVVQAIDSLRRLLDLGLQAAGHFAQQGQGGRSRCCGLGLLDDGEAGHGLAFGVVGGALGEVCLLVVLVAFGFADGQGHGQVEAAQEMFEVRCVLAGGIDADVEARLRMLALQLFEAFAEGLIAGSTFKHGERLGGRLPIGAQEGNAVTVACGVDADAKVVEGTDGGHGILLGNEGWHRPKGLALIVARRPRVSSGNLRPGDPCDERSKPHDVPKPFAKAGGDNLF
jgi:hypothetical protein